MTYLIRATTFLGALGLIVLIERVAFGMSQPTAKVMHWIFVVALAFELQMFVNDLVAYLGADWVTAYRVRYDSAEDKEIPILSRLLVLYPAFAAGLAYGVWYSAYHSAESAVFRGPPP